MYLFPKFHENPPIMFLSYPSNKEINSGNKLHQNVFTKTNIRTKNLRTHNGATNLETVITSKKLSLCHYGTDATAEFCGSAYGAPRN